MFSENLFRYFSKNRLNIIIMVLFPFVFIFLYRFFYSDTMNKNKEDLYLSIPAIMVYNSNIPLNEILEPIARSPERTMASHTFPLSKEVPGEVVKLYYTEQLLQLGWVESGYKAEIDYRDAVHYSDRFTFDKGEYRISLEIAPPLYKNRKNNSSYSYEKSWYGISFAKKGLLD